MSTVDPQSVSRRRALTGLGVGGLGIAFATARSGVAAQDATPAVIADHPIVGTWMVDLVPDDTTDPPTVIICTVDGAVFDPVRGTGGRWQPTGPRSVAWTLVGPAPDGSAAAIVARAAIDVDESGAHYTGSASITLVAPDGTVMGAFPNVPHGTRLPIEPVEAGGSPLAGFPIWAPATPEPATPNS